MIRMPARLVASILMCAGLAAGDAAPAPADELSPAAKRAMASAAEAIGKARTTYQSAAAKEQDKLVAALQKEQETQTKAGKLEAALAVKAMVDKVKSGDYLKDLDAKAAEEGDLLGDRPSGTAPPVPLARLAGTWVMEFNNDWRRMVRIEPDGRVSVLRSNNVPVNSTYSIAWDAKAKAFVSSGLGAMLEVYRPNGERLDCEHWCDGSRYPAEACSMTAMVERSREGQPGGREGRDGPPAARAEGGGQRR